MLMAPSSITTWSHPNGSDTQTQKKKDLTLKLARSAQVPLAYYHAHLNRSLLSMSDSPWPHRPDPAVHVPTMPRWHAETSAPQTPASPKGSGSFAAEEAGKPRQQEPAKVHNATMLSKRGSRAISRTVARAERGGV
jgi:hypothetical protein